MRREFTGRDMLMVLVIGFGIVVAVNFYMAGQASRIFSGVVVENSYHASQKFNTWLQEAERGKQLGWQAELTRGEDGHLNLQTDGIPSNALIEAELRRPVGERETQTVTFTRINDTSFRSDLKLDDGRWIARVQITDGSDSWAFESELK